MMATAYWVDAPTRGSLRGEAVPVPQAGEVLVRTLYTGISRGTSPRNTIDYLNVGVVEQGPADLIGRTVFALYPHQSAFVIPASAVAVVSDDVPARRAALAGAVETAVNILWDAAPLVGDRVTVIGAGMIGCAVARLARGIPGVEVVVVDIDVAKAEVCERLGVAYARPADAPRDRDLVIDTSGSDEGLQLAIDTAGPEGEIIEASWFGDRAATVRLGGAFHSRRLTIRSSQVGMVAPRRRGTRTTNDRLALALRLLRDPAFDHLLTGDSSWRELPEVMAAIAAGSLPGLCHTIDWRDSG